MTYTITKFFTFDDFIAQYGDDFHYELADGELMLGIPEYWIADFQGLGGTAFIGRPKQPTFTV